MKPREYFKELSDIVQSIKNEQMPLIYKVGQCKIEWNKEIETIQKLYKEFEEFETIQGELVAEKYRQVIVGCLEKLDWIKNNFGTPQYLIPIFNSVTILLFRWQSFLKISKKDFPNEITQKYKPLYNRLIKEYVIKGDYVDFVAFMERTEPGNKLEFILQSPKKNGISRIALLEFIILAGYNFRDKPKDCTRLTNNIARKYFNKEIDSSVWQKPQSKNYNFLKNIFESTR